MSYSSVHVFFVGFPKKEMFKYYAIFCVSPNSIISLSFRCWSIPVSEIREFNWKKKKKKAKKKMNTSKNDYFQFNILVMVKMDPFFNQA